MRIIGSAALAAMCLAACSGAASPEARAAKAAELGVALSDFDGAEPVLLSLAMRNDILLAALSLRSDFPKPAKRQIQFEVLTTGMACVTAYGDEETSFNPKLEQFNERASRSTMQIGTAADADFGAFTEAVDARRGEDLADLLDLASLIPAETAEKLAEGDPPIGDTPSLAQCRLLFSRMSSGRLGT